MRLKKIHTVLILIGVLSFFAVPIVQAVTAEPGSDDDPIVTQSYVDEQVGLLAAKVNELTGKVDDLTNTVSELTTQVSDLESKLANGGAGGSKFEVIKLTAGQQLIAGASAEIIVRAGKTTAIAGEKGGLSDVTSDKGGDLMTGAEIPLNHLLIVSRDDGRGIKAVSNEVYILFKGEYTLK